MSSSRVIRQYHDVELYAKPKPPEQPQATQEAEESEQEPDPYAAMLSDIATFNQGAGLVSRAPRPAPPHDTRPQYAPEYGAPSHVSGWTRDGPSISTSSYAPGGAVMAQPEGTRQYEALFQTELGRAPVKPRAKKSTTAKPRRKIPR